MTGLLVDPDDLRTASGLVGDAAAAVGPAFEGRSPDLGAAGSGTSAWAANRTLTEAMAAWGPFVGATRDRMRASADHLRAMADAFVEAEWQSAKRQRRLGGAFVE